MIIILGFSFLFKLGNVFSNTLSTSTCYCSCPIWFNNVFHKVHCVQYNGPILQHRDRNNSTLVQTL